MKNNHNNENRQQQKNESITTTTKMYSNSLKWWWWWDGIDNCSNIVAFLAKVLLKITQKSKFFFFFYIYMCIWVTDLYSLSRHVKFIKIYPGTKINKKCYKIVIKMDGAMGKLWRKIFLLNIFILKITNMRWLRMCWIENIELFIR